VLKLVLEGVFRPFFLFSFPFSGCLTNLELATFGFYPHLLLRVNVSPLHSGAGFRRVILARPAVSQSMGPLPARRWCDAFFKSSLSALLLLTQLAIPSRIFCSLPFFSSLHG